MREDLPAHIAAADLISLDHDLVAEPGEPDPGDGLEVAIAMAALPPTCPVILHSTNIDRVASMTRELADGGWTTHRVAPYGMGEDWIDRLWLPKVRSLLA
jgi:hypothetical protein